MSSHSNNKTLGYEAYIYHSLWVFCVILLWRLLQLDVAAP